LIGNRLSNLHKLTIGDNTYSGFDDQVQSLVQAGMTNLHTLHMWSHATNPDVIFAGGYSSLTALRVQSLRYLSSLDVLPRLNTLALEHVRTGSVFPSDDDVILTSLRHLHIGKPATPHIVNEIVSCMPRLRTLDFSCGQWDITRAELTPQQLVAPELTYLCMRRFVDSSMLYLCNHTTLYGDDKDGEKMVIRGPRDGGCGVSSSLKILVLIAHYAPTLNTRNLVGALAEFKVLRELYIPNIVFDSRTQVRAVLGGLVHIQRLALALDHVSHLEDLQVLAGTPLTELHISVRSFHLGQTRSTSMLPLLPNVVSFSLMVSDQLMGEGALRLMPWNIIVSMKIQSESIRITRFDACHTIDPVWDESDGAYVEPWMPVNDPIADPQDPIFKGRMIIIWGGHSDSKQKRDDHHCGARYASLTGCRFPPIAPLNGDPPSLSSSSSSSSASSSSSSSSSSLSASTHPSLSISIDNEDDDEKDDIVQFDKNKPGPFQSLVSPISSSPVPPTPSTPPPRPIPTPSAPPRKKQVAAKSEYNHKKKLFEMPVSRSLSEPAQGGGGGGGGDGDDRGKRAPKPRRGRPPRKVATEPIYCICRKGWGNRQMVQCDNQSCGKWFHIDCLRDADPLNSSLTYEHLSASEWRCADCTH
jgi:hypothetical protein